MSQSRTKSREEDSIQMAARLAIEMHERGELELEALLEILERCVNARAATNGYAERFGLPFPQHTKDD